jgi:hypothetical protein
MTAEMRTVIELKDIKAVEFECRKEGCRGKITVPLVNFKEAQKHCPLCHTQWFIDDTSHSDLNVFLGRMDDFSRSSGPYVMRLEIAGASKA